MFFFMQCILESVMNLKTSKELLSNVMKTAQTGQAGIRSVLDTSMCPALRNTLEKQLQEYDRIESEAHSLATQRGWELPELDPAVRFFSDRITRIRLNRGSCDSSIADIMIRVNTRGMIQGLKDLHQYPYRDDRISSICQKLLDCETANIRQMQNFL